MEIGRGIRNARKSAGYSQNELTDLINKQIKDDNKKIGRGVVGNWERNQNLPDIEKLVIISRITRHSLSDLIGLSEDSKYISEKKRSLIASVSEPEQRYGPEFEKKREEAQQVVLEHERKLEEYKYLILDMIEYFHAQTGIVMEDVDRSSIDLDKVMEMIDKVRRSYENIRRDISPSPENKKYFED